MLPLIFLLNKTPFFILLMIFCPFAFAIRGSDITGFTSVAILMFISALLIFNILFTIITVVVLSKKWNKTNKVFEKISRNMKSRVQ